MTTMVLNGTASQTAMKWVTLLVMFALAAVPAAAFADIERANVYDIDGMLTASVDVHRNSEQDLTVSVFVPELGVFVRRGPFEDADSRFTTTLHAELPDAEPGDYLVRISVRNENGKKNVYRHVFI
jgi:hypothetical protein